MNSSYPFGFVSSVRMKTHPIMIIATYSTKSNTSNCVMEFSFVDSISKLVHTDSKPKNSKSTTIDSWVESFVEYSNPKLFLVDSKLEFVAKPKFPNALLERCLLVEFQIFIWFLPKFDGPKIVSNLVVSYFDFLMLATKCFWLIMVFNVAWFLAKPFWKSFCESSLCSLAPLMVASSPLRAFPKY